MPRDPDPALILELPAGSALERTLRRDPPDWFGPDVVVVGIEADQEGRIPAPLAGQVVLTVPSPEALPRQAGEIQRVIDGEPDESEPAIVIVEEAEFLRAEEMAPVLEASRRTRRSVILRVIGAS
jgi:hypothetical protein